MAGLHQYYEAAAPFDVPGEPEQVLAAWRSHRARLRHWLAERPPERWSDATRCTEWRVTEMAAHLVSATQFLGFTLHEAKKGNPTALLRGFDPQAVPVAKLDPEDAGAPSRLLAELTDLDARIDAELDGFSATDWNAPAESPPGRVSARLSLMHFLFDSWVHEHDLMVPAGELPVIDRGEASIVAGYVFGLAGIARAVDEGPRPDAQLQLRLSDIDVGLRIEVTGGRASVLRADDDQPCNASGAAADLVSIATGRAPEGKPVMDDAAAAYLRRLAARMS